MAHPSSGQDMKRRALKGFLWTTLERWGARIASTTIFIALARHIEPDDLGLVALSGSIVSVATVLQQQGLGVALVQRPNLNKSDIDTAFWASLLLSAGLSLFMSLAASPISSALGQPDLSPVLRIQAIGMVIGGAGSVPTALLQRQLNFRPIALRRLIATVVAGGVGLVMAMHGAGVWALVTQGVLDVTISTAVIWIAARWSPGLSVNRKAWRELFCVGSRITALDLLNVANVRLDDFLVGTFLGTAALGYYSVAYRFIVVTTELFIGIVSTVTLPAFSRMQDDRVRIREAMTTAVTWVSIISFPAFLGLIAIASDVTVVMFGREWIPSVPVMQILAVSGLLQAIRSANSPILIAINHAGWIMNVSLAATALNAIGFAVGLRWGIVGVALSSAIRNLLVTPATFALVRRAVGFRLRSLARPLLRILAASFLMTGAVVMAGLARPLLGPTMHLVSLVSWGAIIYLVGLRMICPDLIEDGIAMAHAMVGRPPNR